MKPGVFYVYVSNRVQRIRRSSNPEQWRYVPTDQNPADHATRFVPAAHLQNTNWLSGPKFLLMPESGTSESTYNLVDPSSDLDVRPLVSTLSTTSTIQAAWFPAICQILFLEVTNRCHHSPYSHSSSFQDNWEGKQFLQGLALLQSRIHSGGIQ